MKMNFLNVGIVNFSFRRSQCFKDPDCPIFCLLADACGLNDLANFFQPAMSVRVLRSMFMLLAMRMLVAVLVRMAVVVAMLV